MKNALLVAIPFVTALAGVGAGKIAQDRYTVQVKINAAINEPDKVAPTAERLATVKLPDGFKLTKFAGIENPRWLVTNTDGTVYVSQRVPGTVTMLKDLDGDGVADAQTIVFRRKLSHGLAIHKGMLYVVTVNEVYRAPIMKDGTLGVIQQLIKDLPDGGQHLNRTIAFGPDGKMYISVGSTCNACNESSPESATMLVADADGKNRRIFASGLRNTIGFGWHPVSGRLFGMDHGIDWLGDDEQPEEFNEIVDGKRYGWPYIYADGKANPQDEPPTGFTVEGWRAQSNEPLLMYRAHSAPLQMSFYTGSQFPEEYRNDGFQTMRGSWNRAQPSGYEIVRQKYDDAGAPEGIEPFMTGFLIPGGGLDGRDVHMGRLVGLTQAKDGAMLFTDDTNNQIYRISYGQPEAATMADQDGLTYEKIQVEGRLDVKADSFTEGGTIPLEHSRYGPNRSPALTWSGAPAGTKGFVILMEDPDALSPKPYVHWLAANIPASFSRLGVGVEPKPMPAALGGGVQGGNSTGGIGYFGMMPPASDPAHNYHFEVYALDTKLDLKPGFNRHALMKAMEGHVLAKGEVVGAFKKEG